MCADVLKSEKIRDAKHDHKLFRQGMLSLGMSLPHSFRSATGTRRERKPAVSSQRESVCTQRATAAGSDGSEGVAEKEVCGWK